jgi:hypothetical protein
MAKLVVEGPKEASYNLETTTIDYRELADRYLAPMVSHTLANLGQKCNQTAKRGKRIWQFTALGLTAAQVW